jgi:uncharacterized protein YjcR
VPKLNLVGLAEIAEMANVAPATVRTWARRGQLPEPDAKLSCGPVWHRATISAWLRRSAVRERVLKLQPLA